MVIEIRSIGFKNCDTSRVISLSYIKCDKLLFVALLTVIWSINASNSLDQQHHHGTHHSYGGQFVGEEEAEAISVEADIRLAKIPCNFTTKTNCIYAKRKIVSLPIKDFLKRNQQIANEIVVSWVHYGLIITPEKNFKTNNSSSNNSNNINNVREKAQNGFYNFNWIFELLACMMLASAFEICLLVLRNLRNISLAFFEFWSSLNARLHSLCVSCNGVTSSQKSDQSRKQNVAVGEKRTLSYIFAILTWRASHTAKGSVPTAEDNLRDEANQNPICYGHVTTMGDLLLLILFTHVYYQRQRFHQSVENEVNAEPEHLLKINKDKAQNNKTYHKFYDVKQNNNDNNNAYNVQSSNRHDSTKRCSHFCGNMYQQISSSIQEGESTHNKLTTLTSCATKKPYVTYCTCFVWYTCCFCQYSCRSFWYCYTNCRRWNQHCHIYTPLCNVIYCCCFYKRLKSFHDVNYQHCCYMCCWQDVCNISKLGSHEPFHCCYCHLYCCFCNTLTNDKTAGRTVNLVLFNKMKNSSSPSNDYCSCKLIWNNQSYAILYHVDVQSYSLLHVTDAKSMFLYKHRSCYQLAVDVFSCLLPQYLLTIKNCQALLKCKRIHVAVAVMALIVICASSGGGSKCNHHHYYSSLLNKCNKHFSKSRQNKRRRRRRRRRHQHCKAYRPQHYFYTTLIQCVKRQKTKKLPKNFINKLHKNSAKVLTSSTINFEHSSATTATSPKVQPVRAIRRLRGSKPNIVWLIIGLIWFEGPKMVNCNVIINYQNQQQPEQQQQQQHQQQAGNAHKETTANSVNTNFEYKVENFNQMKTKNSNNNSNSNSNNNNSNNNSNNNNKNKNKNNSNNNNNSNNSTSNINRSSTTSNSSSSNNMHLSVNAIPIINTIHLKHYCNSNYHQKHIRASQRVQRALKSNSNLDTSITSSASLKNNNVNDELESEQMPSSSFQTSNQERHAQSDLMRLESIKHQILFKLGLTRKPNVSHPLPKQFIWDTIYRADGINSLHEFSNTNHFQAHQHFTTHQNYPYWGKTPSMRSTVLPASEDRYQDSNGSEVGTDVEPRKYGKNRQQLQQQEQQQQQTHSKHYNNDIMYRKGATATSTTKNLNQLLYTTTNRNKLINHTNKTGNNFTILKQSKHQQFYKNSPHSTTIKSGKQPIIHQQKIDQHTNNNIENNIKNNNNNNNNINNNNNNNSNNVNNSNNKNSNNIIMVQKQLRNNNKYIEEEKKFTYLTDINSSEDSLNIMEEHKSPDYDDNNSKRKQNHHQHHYHDHDRTHGHLLQLQQMHEKTTENYQRLNIDGIVDDIGVTKNVYMEPEVIHDAESETDNEDEVADDDGYRDNQHQHRHDYFSKLDAFDENEDFFGSTQEIITFAEKGKMYKNHRLVEFSHQNNEKLKQKLHVRYAEIHIRIDKISLKNKSRAGSGIKRKRLKIWIFQLIENNYTYKGFDHVAQFCASFEVDTSRLGWKKFDITTTVKEWYTRGEGEKLRLLIDCTGCGKTYSVHLFNSYNAKSDVSTRERRIADERRHFNINDINSKHFYNVTRNNDELTNLPYNQTIVVTEKHRSDRRNRINAGTKDDEDVLNSSRPFLVLHTEARRQRRVRRRAINCNGALHGQCCKESFYVSFKALGWDDWIIAPRGYFANYCRGDCTGPYRTPDTFQTFHAHFIEEYRKMGLLNGMQPCCAPIKFSSMSLIYYGDEGIIKRDLPKMVVDECGCP